jgi:hypothetical protein
MTHVRETLKHMNPSQDNHMQPEHSHQAAPLMVLMSPVCLLMQP